MTVTVKKVGGSVGVIIPKSVAQEMGLTEGVALDISPGEGGAIVLRRPGRRARRPLSTLVGKLNRAAYRKRNREFAEDRPVGREVW